MGTKADFYIGIGANAEWFGSLLQNGDPWHIPIEIFIQVNRIMFEELTLDFLKKCNGVIAQNKDKWPHIWSDSRVSDYSYIFYPGHEKVYMYQMGCELLFDPVKILQGFSIMESNSYLDAPIFPLMRKETKMKTEEILKEYGYPYTATV